MKKELLSSDEINRREHYQELVNLMPFRDKVLWAKKKIKEFFEVCIKDKSITEITVSFSGGKDSTVLLDLVMKVHKEIKCKIPIVMVYATEITFPSTIKFINDINQKYRNIYGDNLKQVQLVKPKKTWLKILSENGYPIYSKQVSTLINRVKNAKTMNNLTQWFFGINQDKTSTAKFRLSKDRLFLLDDVMLNEWPKLNAKEKQYFERYNEKYFFSEKCCDFIKGNLKHDKRPSFIGTMIVESELRKKSWIKSGCNIFNKNAMKSRPLSIWTNNDVWRYIKENDLEINPAYNFDKKLDIDKQNLRFERLGCTSCPYGSFMEQKKIIRIKNKEIEVGSYAKLNRFEKLYQDYPNLYKSQIIANGMYKVLIDMRIEIREDKLYMSLYKKRRKQIEDWYDDKNFRTNILRVMCQIENYGDFKGKGKSHTWKYSLNHFKQALKFFNLNLSKDIKKEISKIREEVADKFHKYANQL